MAACFGGFPALYLQASRGGGDRADGREVLDDFGWIAFQ